MPNLANCRTYPELESRSHEHKNTGIPKDAHCNATVDCTTSAKRVFLQSCGDGGPASTPIPGFLPRQILSQNPAMAPHAFERMKLENEFQSAALRQ